MKANLKLVIALLFIIAATSCKEKEVEIGCEFDYYFNPNTVQKIDFSSNLNTVEIKKVDTYVTLCSVDMCLLYDEGDVVDGVEDSRNVLVFGNGFSDIPIPEVDFEWGKLIFDKSKILIQVTENTSKHQRYIQINIKGPKINPHAIFTEGQIWITQKGI